MSKNKKKITQYFKTPAAISLMHSLIVISVITCLVTGFRIASSGEPIGWLHAIIKWLPQGAVHGLHFFTGALLFASFIIYIIYVFATKRFSRFALQLTTPLLNSKTLYENALRLSMIIGLILLAVSLISGIMQFFGWTFNSYQLVNSIHRTSATALIIYILIHTLLAFLAKGLPALKARFFLLAYR